jgi:uncharacterized membrane protein YphA (DoxX/SURF4 family)
MTRQLAIQISLTLLRAVSGLLFLQAGGLKLFGWFGGMPPNGATAELMTQTGIGGLLELVGGALMILGLFTRVTAFILSGEMAVAYWQFHAPAASGRSRTMARPPSTSASSSSSSPPSAPVITVWTP